MTLATAMMMTMILVKSKMLQSMKKIFSNVMLVAAAATAFFSCQKQEVIAPETSQEVMLTFASEKPAFDDETKTEWTGETIQWSEGDRISVAYTVEGNWQNASGDASGDAKLYKSETLDAASETAQFTVSTSFKGTTEGAHVFYGVYPAPAETGFADAPVAVLNVPAIQTPKADSFDPNGDLMVGVSGNYDSRPESGETISLMWNRLVAHAVITLKNLNGFTAGETLTGITLTAQEGANLVGDQKVNLVTSEVVNNDAESNVLTLSSGNLTVDATGTMTFWACVLPETITALTVEVTTDKATYTREITGISKTFKQNARNTLAVNMATATREAKETESWVLVTPADGLTEGTYALVASTNTKTGVLVSTNGTSSAPTFNTSVVVEENILKGVAESMQFDLAAVDGGYTLAVAGQTTNYLYTTNTNNGVRVGTNANKVWTIGKHDGNPDAFVFKCNATSRFLGVYSNQDWRCYTAYDATNFTNDTGSSEIYLYKKTVGDVQPDTAPKLEVAEESLSLNASAAEGTVAVTAKNIASIEVRALVEEGAQEESDWLVADYDEANSCVIYSASENESEASRTAYIEVYALDAEGNEVVAGITVTQAGKVVVDTDFEAGDYWIVGVEDGTSHVMLPLASSATYGYASSAVINDNRTFAKYAFTFEAVDGGYKIKDSEGKYYGTGASYKSFQITSAVWNVSVQNDGTCLITDASTGKTIKYGDGTYTTFGVYTESDTNTGVYPMLVKADNPLPVELSSIAVSGATTSYEINDSFEFDGTVTATYNDGSTKAVTPTSVSSPDMSAAGNQTVTVTYTEGSITKTAEYTIEIVDPNAGGGDVTVKPVTETITFDANKTQRTSFSGNEQVWTSGNVTFTNAKASSSNDVADYSNPVRLYQNSTVTIAATGSITEIVIESDGTAKYKTALQNSLTGAGYTYTNSGNDYTVTLSSESSVTFSLTAQARFKSVKVTYTPSN